MRVEDFFSYLADAAYFLIFGATLLDAIRHPRRVTLDAALFFGALAAVLATTLASQIAGRPLPPLVSGAPLSVVMALPYLLLRLADDFAGVRPSILRASLVLLAPIVVAAFVLRPPYPSWFTALLVLYFAGLTAHATGCFMVEARRAPGITGRRMQAVALGSAFLTAAILFAGLGALFPTAQAPWGTASAMASLGCGVSFFLGFSPPSPVRRLWREADVRRFVELTTTLPASLPGSETLPRLSEAVATALGARDAVTILWSVEEGRLVAPGLSEPPNLQPRADPTLAAQVFESQRPLFVEDATKADPRNAERYRAFGATALVLVPITTQDRRWGVLSAFSDRPSIFAEDDLVLLGSFASVIGVFLTRSELVRQDVERRAQADALRLKEEFLSAAAHDLRSPLTVLLGQAQLMRRRLRRGTLNPELDLEALEAIVTEGRRMRRLANGLLDAARMEAGQFVLELAPTDLTALADRVATFMGGGSHHIVVEGPPVVALADRERILQVLENLVENAVKFSPEADTVEVRLSAEEAGPDAPNGTAHIVVRDYGVGIPASELDVIFERFKRGAGLDGRFRGSGVGLYLCKRIVEEHHGRIWAECEPGEHTELHVSLSLAESVPQPETDAARQLERAGA